MASAPETDWSCPVCCDIYEDPVLLLCGHSFCARCLQEWWRQSGLRTCPVCKELFTMAKPPRNLALRDLSDALRREKDQIAGSGPPADVMCSLHGEKLKLFCQDDKQLICVICRDAQKHKKHNCVPLDEAAGSCRAQLKLKVVHLKTKLGLFEAQKLQCNEMAGHIKLQDQQTEKKIKEEFQKLHQFLRAEEATRIKALKYEAGLKSEAMNITIVNLTAEIKSLKDKIQTAEREAAAKDNSFMLNVKSIMKRAKCNLPEPEAPLGALVDEAKHLGNLLFTVWKKMQTIVQYTPVTLDPNTGSSSLTISEHMTRSTIGRKSHPLPSNPERRYNSGVLGSEGFSSGKHSWDVEMGGYWTVGVAVKTKRPSSEKIWGMSICPCSNVLVEYTLEGDGKVLLKDSFPKKIRVQLDYDQGILSFSDLDWKTHVHTIKYTFTKTVFPYFSENARIRPAELSVTIKKAK